ncbi:hypothetical protein AKJ49_00505 [candidate division MSBL1 archaeon SCGC-AAA382A03]|uniref:Uncharacterized protein n=1 Tax=candidate division MSBL1 archaeon SCGC-AAA382A03 TaxID=1698278 RepID=A0A133VGM3_9EURY|nr:hypothetical protein AKJ49_00505 [candidate division MSBL1 archaeon SCGC-AAA382A03]
MFVFRVFRVVRRLSAGDTVIECGFSEALELSVYDLVRLAVILEVEDDLLRLSSGERTCPHRTGPTGCTSSCSAHGESPPSTHSKREKEGGENRFPPLTVLTEHWVVSLIFL